MKKTLFKGFKTLLMPLLLILAMINNANAGILLDRIVVIIDRDVITWSELYKAMEFEMRKNITGLDTKAKIKYLNDYGDLFLEKMIDMEVQLNYAKKHNMSVSEQEVNGTIEDIASKNSMSMDEFKIRLTQEGFNWDEYKDMLSKQLLISKVVRTEVRNKVVVPDEAIAEYLKKNSIKSGSETVKIRQIFLSTKQNKSDKEKLAQDIYKELKSGVEFQKLAMQYSEGVNAKGGGDLGYVEFDDLNKQYKTEINKLMIGQTSLPFSSPEGITLIQLVDKRPPLTPEQIRDEVKEKLFGEVFEKAHKDWIKSLKEKTYMQILL